MKKALLILIALLCISAQGMCISVTYVECTWDGTKVVKTNKSESGCSPIPNVLERADIENSGWYFVDGVQTRNVVYIKGAITVNLILKNGSKLKAPIHFLNNSAVLNIYAQEGGTGEIDADASSMSDLDCAGIGGTERDGHYHCGTINIHGGKITAKGAEYGAGIGGGDGGNGGYVTIFDGIVNAYGGVDAAGIGGGEGGNGGTLTIYGGTVFADGTGWGAGIGGGEDGTGATVKILGGSVTAWAGADASNKNGSAIGSHVADKYGSLTIGGKMMVYAGNTSGSKSRFKTSERVSACRYRPYAEVKVCDHGGSPSYVIDKTAGTHSLKCLYCNGVDPEKHTFDVDGYCTVCHVKSDVYTISIYLPKKEGGTFKEEYDLTPENRDVVAGQSIVLPTPPDEYIPTGCVFAGWVTGTPTEGESYIKTESEIWKRAGESYEPTASIGIKACFIKSDISLENNADNSSVLITNNGKVVNSVTLAGRTLYKDGAWNTLCLPFDVTIGSSIFADADVRTLSSSSWNSTEGKLTLTFIKEETKILAGKPYLVKWSSGEKIENPKFDNVTIDMDKNPVKTEYMDFIGTFSPANVFSSGSWKIDLYIKSDNKLYYPAAAYSVKSCRAYFSLSGGLYIDAADGDAIKDVFGGSSSSSREMIILDFGDEQTTGFGRIENGKLIIDLEDNIWYTLDGHRLVGKPTQKGIYIHKGRKVIVK